MACGRLCEGERNRSRARSTKSRTAANISLVLPTVSILPRLALIFRACRADKGPIDSEDHVFSRPFGNGLRVNLGFHFRLDRLSHHKDTIACRRVIETLDLRQELI